MAEKQTLSTRQRQMRELEEQAQDRSVVDAANRPVNEKKPNPEFVVPGPGGQFVGEAEDNGYSPADLVVRRTAGHVLADKEGRDLEADREAKASPTVKVGDNDLHEAEK